MSYDSKQQAIAKASSIAAMLAALDVDYNRLEELREFIDTLRDAASDIDVSDEAHAEAVEALKDYQLSHSEEIAELEEYANGCITAYDAEEAIASSSLEVCVRSSWYCPGHEGCEKPSEFYILLCCGGPTVRVRGELDNHLRPCRAWIEYADNGKFSELVGEIPLNVLLQYCQQFYFGE